MATHFPSQDPLDDDIAHEINVTPFIDVVLVLLIIFMVAGPLSLVETPVNLPASGAPKPSEDAPPITVTQQADGTVTIQHKPIGAAGLQAALDALTQGDRDRRIFVEADKQTAYGDLMGLMDRLREAGYLKIGLMGTVPQ